MKKYKKHIVVICVMILIISHFLMTNIAANEAKNVIGLYDIKKFLSVDKGIIQNYDEVIKNEDINSYSLLRYKYNTEYYKNACVELDNYGYGASWRKSYYLYGYIVITSESRQSMLDEINPVNRSSEIPFYRITLLKKYNGKWYIEKDIFDYNDKVGITQLLDTEYTKKQIIKYEDYLLKILQDSI